MMNARILVNMISIAVLAIGLYLVKYSVADVQRDVVKLRGELANERESLHLLNAEWAYLNRPERLRRLADRHLDLAPMDSRQIGHVAVLPAAATVAESQPQLLLHPVAQTAEAR